MEKLFDKSDDKIRRVVRNFLPALTTWDKAIKSVTKTHAGEVESSVQSIKTLDTIAI